jgi:hypothetical protein
MAAKPCYLGKVVNQVSIMKPQTTKGEAVSTAQANSVPGGIQAGALALPMRVFAAHVGAGQPVDGYGATPWRKWLIVGVCNVWYAVRKDAPLARPVACRCALADVKAHLRAGSVVCRQA